jgi:hypothetical protein
LRGVKRKTSKIEAPEERNRKTLKKVKFYNRSAKRKEKRRNVSLKGSY